MYNGYNHDSIFFTQSKHLVGRTIVIGTSFYPLEYTIRPGMTNGIKGVHVEILAPEGYPQTPVLKQMKCFARLYISFTKNQLHLYRFNNYLSKVFDIATPEERMVSRRLGKKMLKFVLRWIQANVGTWFRIILHMTRKDKLLTYFTKMGFEIVNQDDPSRIEMSASMFRFL